MRNTPKRGTSDAGYKTRELAFLLISIVAGLLLGIPFDKVISSVQKGLGDTLGSLLFALSMQGLYRRCALNIPNVRCIAVADDLNIIGSADSVFKAFGRFDRSLGTGLALRKDKCAVLWPKVSDPPRLCAVRRLG